MNKKTTFAIGLLVGMLLMLVTISAFQTYINNRRWGGGLSPNAKVEQIYSLVNRHSIVPFDRAEMVENMYRGLLAGVGDPYTQYFCVDSLEDLRTRTAGTFVGIGVRAFVDPADQKLTLERVFQGAPAYNAGLLHGDKVYTVDGKDVVGMLQSDIVDMILGEAGTTVVLGIYRPDENRRFDVDIVRAQVIVPTVSHEMLEIDGRKTGFIRIDGFEDPTYSQFAHALEELIYLGMDSLIIDLRNNPGGLLNRVVQISNRLVPEGIITFTEDVDGYRRYSYSSADYLGLPLVVLINERSASASEVLAGAVQDTGVGSLVGQQSFGKGIVQNLFSLSDQTAIKLTIAKYFTPNGISIHDIGLTPDFVVEMDDADTRRIGTMPHEDDVQLQIAIRMVHRK